MSLPAQIVKKFESMALSIKTGIVTKEGVWKVMHTIYTPRGMQKFWVKRLAKKDVIL